MQIKKVNITFVYQEFYRRIFFLPLSLLFLFLINLGNHMLPVPESAIQTISLSTRKLELPRILYIHKYWKMKHIRNMHFLFFFFFPHLNKLSHSNAWPGTASIYIYIYNFSEEVYWQKNQWRLLVLV